MLCSLLCNTGVFSYCGQKKKATFGHIMVYYISCVIKIGLYKTTPGLFFSTLPNEHQRRCSQPHFTATRVAVLCVLVRAWTEIPIQWICECVCTGKRLIFHYNPPSISSSHTFIYFCRGKKRNWINCIVSPASMQTYQSAAILRPSVFCLLEDDGLGVLRVPCRGNAG